MASWFEEFGTVDTTALDRWYSYGRGASERGMGSIESPVTAHLERSAFSLEAVA